MIVNKVVFFFFKCNCSPRSEPDSTLKGVEDRRERDRGEEGGRGQKLLSSNIIIIIIIIIIIKGKQTV